MKIAVYQIERVDPKNEDEEADILDILDMPSLKLGYAEFVGKFSHWITKSDLKGMTTVSQKFYDRNHEVWREGVLITNSETKLFAQYAGKL